MQTPRARPHGRDSTPAAGRGWRRGGRGRAPEARPLALREAGLVRRAGLRAFEWTSGVPPASPSRAFRSGRRSMAPADAGLTRLPLRGQRRNSTGFPFSRASRAGSPVGARTVGKRAPVMSSARRLHYAASASWRPLRHAAFTSSSPPHSRPRTPRPKSCATTTSATSQVTIKADKSPVTEADVETEKAIRGDPRRALPGARLLRRGDRHRARSTPTTSGSSIPIDGTKAFVREYPMFSTQIALMHRGRLIVGVSSAPVYGELAYGEIGVGAWLERAADPRERASTRSRMRRCRPATSRRWRPARAGPRSAGSSAG